MRYLVNSCNPCIDRRIDYAGWYRVPPIFQNDYTIGLDLVVWDEISHSNNTYLRLYPGVLRIKEYSQSYLNEDYNDVLVISSRYQKYVDFLY